MRILSFRHWDEVFGSPALFVFYFIEEALNSKYGVK